MSLDGELVWVLVGVAGFLLTLYHSKRYWDWREKTADSIILEKHR